MEFLCLKRLSITFLIAFIISKICNFDIIKGGGAFYKSISWLRSIYRLKFVIDVHVRSHHGCLTKPSFHMIIFRSVIRLRQQYACQKSNFKRARAYILDHNHRPRIIYFECTRLSPVFYFRAAVDAMLKLSLALFFG